MEYLSYYIILNSPFLPFFDVPRVHVERLLTPPRTRSGLYGPTIEPLWDCQPVPSSALLGT